jgi:hypothetical protein
VPTVPVWPVGVHIQAVVHIIIEIVLRKIDVAGFGMIAMGRRPGGRAVSFLCQRVERNHTGHNQDKSYLKCFGGFHKRWHFELNI